MAVTHSLGQRPDASCGQLDAEPTVAVLTIGRECSSVACPGVSFRLLEG